MSTEYKPADEVRDIAERLIAEVPDHRDLDGIRIDYVWRPEASRRNDRLVLGKARCITGLNAFLTQGANDPFFVIEVAANTWALMKPAQRETLVDHELCHLGVDEDGDGEPKLVLRGHDLEEFAAVVKRHGFWKSDVAKFSAQVAEQLTLAIEDASRFGETTEEEG